MTIFLCRSLTLLTFFFTPLAMAEGAMVSAAPPKSSLKKKRPSPPKKPFTPKPTPLPQKMEPADINSDATEMLYPHELGKDISDLVVGLANRIDSFFGDARSDDEKNGSTLRLVPSYTFYDHRPGVSELGVNLNLKLKNLEDRAKKFEQSLRKELLETAEEATGTKGPFLPKSNPEENEWHYNFESKLAARPAIYYSGKLRVRRNFQHEIFLHHIFISAGWDTDDYWSQTTSFNSDHALSEILLFRFINEANWYISKQRFQTTHGPSLIHSINKYNSVSYNFRIVFGTEEEQFHHLETGLSVNYRHGTPSKRLFIDLIPAYTYPRTEHYHEVRSFEVRMEYLFGDIG